MGTEIRAPYAPCITRARTSVPHMECAVRGHGNPCPIWSVYYAGTEFHAPYAPYAASTMPTSASSSVPSQTFPLDTPIPIQPIKFPVANNVSNFQTLNPNIENCVTNSTILSSASAFQNNPLRPPSFIPQAPSQATSVHGHTD